MARHLSGLVSRIDACVVNRSRFPVGVPIRAVILTLWCLGMAQGLAYAGAAPNLLEDPGFENVSPAGGLRVWQANAVYPFNSVQVVRSDPNYVHSGDTAVKLTQTNVAANGTGIFGAFLTAAAIPVEPLVEYTMSFWARGEGKVSASVYGYNDQGNVYEPFAVTQVTKADEQSPDTLVGDKAWKPCLYTFRLPKDTKVKSVRFVINAHGTVHVDDCCFMRADTAALAAPSPVPIPETAASDTVASRPNLISINRTSTPPKPDGQIATNEYPTGASGLIGCLTQSLYPQPSEWHFAYDEQNLYFAFALQLPPGTELTPTGAFRDDSALIAAGNAFYLFIRPDADVVKKTFEGAYLGVSPNGVFYDAWERIDHAALNCQRDAAFNARWQVATSQKDGRWTIELAVPWLDLKMHPPQPDQVYALSFGMNLNNQRLAWQSHPIWYDYPQAFGLMRLAGDALKMETPPLNGLNRGELAAVFRLANASTNALSYDLTYLISSVRMIEGSIGSWVLDVVGDVKQREAVAEKSLFCWHQAGTVKAGESKDERGEFKLKEPSYYVLEMESRLNGRPYFYQKVPFQCFPPIVATLAPVPSKEQIHVHLAFYGAVVGHQSMMRVDFQNSKGNVVLSHKAPVEGDEMDFPVSMAALAPGDYRVTFTLLDEKKQPFASRVETFRKWETPVWLKHREGIKALDANWVPAPWTPIQKSDVRSQESGGATNTQPVAGGGGATCVSVWGRTFDFAPGSLLAGMTSQKTPLLAEGISAQYLVKGKTQDFAISKPRVPLKKRGRVEVTQQGESPAFTLSSLARIEFDGLLRYDMTITPKQGTKVDKLWISIPFEHMPYGCFSGDAKSKTGLIDSLDFTEPGRWYFFWLGTDKVGCSFFIESHKGWLINSTKPRITLQTEGNKRVLRLLIVNDPAEISVPLAFTFALHPTPIKPFFKNWRDIRPDGLGMGKPPINLSMIHAWIWNSGDGKPSPRNWQVLTDMVAYLRGRGQRVYPYIGTYFITPYNHIRPETPFIPQGERGPTNMLVKTKKDATRVEEYFYYKRDWDLAPPVINDGDMETEEEVRTSPSSTYADFFVYGIAEILRRSDVDGMYCDIPTSSLDFSAEKGNAYKTKDGVTEGTYELFANRDLYKRLYFVFDKLRGEGRKPYLLGHGLSFFPGVVSFWDVVFHGEELKPAEPFGCTKMFLQKSGVAAPLAMPDATDKNRTYDAFYFRSLFGSQGGMPVMLLPQYGYQVKLGGMPELSRELLSFTFLHNTLLWPAYIPQQPVFDFWSKVEVPFGMGDTTFYPYWENGVVSRPECIRVSYWKKDGREDYLVGVANWSGKAVDATIALPAPLAVLAQCLDMEKGETLPAGKEWRVTIPAHDLRAFRFGGRSAQ